MDPNQQNSQLPGASTEQPQPEDQNANWQYTSGQLTADQPTQPDQQQNDTGQQEVLAEWSAQEFIEHDKNGKWYMLLAGGAIGVSAVLFIVTKEIMSVIVTLLLAVAVGVYGSAKPKTVNYTIDSNGISLDGKHYMFTEFKSFSVIENSATVVPYIQLMPQKRFMLPITIFVDPAHSKEITEIIGQFIPYDQKQPDFADKLSARFRF